MSTKNLSPWPRVRFMDDDGNPLAGGKLYTYRTGTSSNKATYSDSDGTLNTNPVILDADGYADLWLDEDEPYRFRLETSAGVLVWQRDKMSAASGNVSRSVDTIASLKLITGSSTSTTVINVAGYYAAGDGSGGQFWWDSASTATENGGTIIQATGVSTGRWKRIITRDLTVKDFGAVGDNSTDDSAEFLALDALGVKVRALDDSYKYTSTTNPTFAGGVELLNSHVNGANYNDIINFDANGNLIGIDFNHQEDNQTSLGSNLAITSGLSVSPPISQASPPDDLDVIAHWYQDFGLEYTRYGNGANGSLTWYYWTWNFTTVTYYQDRHPLMGWYRGDDPKVLDWQCYWMREAGIKAVTLNPSSGINTATWSSPTNKYHWLYQLFNNAPNFNGLQYILWGKYTGSLSEITAAWEYLIDNVYLQYKNFYCVRMNGKLYPAIFVFEAGTMSINIGNEAANISFFAAMANRFKAEGYGGLAVFMRHPRSDAAISRVALESVDCLYFAADYSCHGSWVNYAGNATYPIMDDATTYSDMLDSWNPLHERDEWASGVTYADEETVIRNGFHYLCFNAHTSTFEDTPGEGKNSYLYWLKRGPINREIVAIPSSKHAVSPHPSTGGGYWKAEGHTPALFRKWLNRAIDSIMNHGTPPILMLYNVSEWAEGGPGLMPNKQDGFGYLDAIRDTIYRARKIDHVRPVLPTVQDELNDTVTQFLLADMTIRSSAKCVRIDLDFNRTMISTPTINAGFDGQILRLMNIDASYTVTLQDDATLANSNLFLTATSITLGPYDSVSFEYVSGKGWVQITPVTNVL